MKAIVCVDQNWGIGKNNGLLFHIPSDLEYFKQITLLAKQLLWEGIRYYLSLNQNLCQEEQILFYLTYLREMTVQSARTLHLCFGRLGIFPHKKFSSLEGLCFIKL